MRTKPEPDYGRLAAEVLERQRERVCQTMAALIQHIGFIRPSDLRPEEHEALEYAKRYLDGQRKLPALGAARSSRELRIA